MAQAELVEYYRRRAAEYEAIYAMPERQPDLSVLRRTIPERLRGRRVLEVACGTGYWTQRIAEVAQEVVAVDLAEEPMRIAQDKVYGKRPTFRVEDAYALPESLGRFDAALAVFWWSHVPRSRMREFFDSLHARLIPGARVVLMDNLYVEGSSSPIAEMDAEGNTYQLRLLADGSRVRVLKNFPSGDELMPGVTIERLTYYWLAEYRLQ